MPNKNINIIKNIRDLKESATLATNARVAELTQQGRVVHNLGLGQSPFPVPSSVVSALRKHASEKNYLPAKGLPQLRRAVAEYHIRRNKINANADLVLIGPGSKTLIFNLLMVFDGEVIIPTPSWVSYEPQARITGKKIIFLHTKKENRWLVDPKELRELYNKNKKTPRILILNYPGNPTGTTYNKHQLKAIALEARRQGIIVLSDEIYGEMHFNSTHTSIAKYYREGTIICSGISKWCGAGGWRLGTFVFPTELSWLMQAMTVMASETYTSVASPIQHAATEAYKESGEIQNYLYNVRRILRILTKESVQILRSANIDVAEPDGAFYLFADFSAHVSILKKSGIKTSTQLVGRLLEEAGVAVIAGSEFGRREGEFLVRMSLVNFDGKKALSAVKKYPVGKELPKNFCRVNCAQTLMAMEQITNWVNNLYVQQNVSVRSMSRFDTGRAYNRRRKIKF